MSDETSSGTPPARDDPGCPLTGIVVVDLSRPVSGNMLTHVLADLGPTVMTHAPRNVYRTQDGKWVALSAGMEATLARLFEGIGHPGALVDPRFATHEARLRNIDALDDLIQTHLLTLTLDQALLFFAERDITADPVRDIADLMAHPNTVERELLTQQLAADGREVAVHAAPYRINGRRPPIRRQAPSLGQDNHRWLQRDGESS
jgi:formyl-CoA transferase